MFFQDSIRLASAHERNITVCTCTTYVHMYVRASTGISLFWTPLGQEIKHVLIRDVSLFRRLTIILGPQKLSVLREVSLYQKLICTQKYAIGTSETVLIREVSLYQRLICTQKYAIGTSETVLIRKVSLFQRLICTQKYAIGTSETVLIREVSFVL